MEWYFELCYLNILFLINIVKESIYGRFTGCTVQTGFNNTQKKHETEARLADFYLNPLTFVGYRNNCFSSIQIGLYFERYATVLMFIIRAWMLLKRAPLIYNLHQEAIIDELKR